MKVYLQEEVVFDDINDASDFILTLPPYSLARLNAVHVSSENVFFQVFVYCFDDEVDIDS